MKIKEILKERRTISFEFFPPREADDVPGVIDVIKDLQRFNPDFVSVTYGAGGGTRAFTEEITMRLKSETPLEVMAHLTCVAQTRGEVHGVLQRLQQAGIENVIALRGDRPADSESSEPGPDEFPHASDLITHIRESFDFGIAGACYPEGHTESVDLDTDIRYARMKQDLGADFLITQLFYDNSYFFDFQERAAAAGITVPVIPGVLPILSTPQIRRFTSLCGATIPANLDERLDKYSDDNRAVREIGIEHATRQAEELWANGVPGIHFYVLNRRYSVSHILSNLDIAGHTGAQSSQ